MEKNVRHEQKKNALMGALSKIIRVITLPPLMAAAAVMVLHRQLGVFPGKSVGAALFFLCLMPLAAYPICRMVPALHRKGRKMQRNMAVVFSVLGYAGGLMYCLWQGLRGLETVLFLTYLFSGVVIALLTGCFHFKCSGHACGMAGPVTLLGMQLSPLCFLGYGLLVPVFVSSIRLHRHTREELIAGALTPALLLVLLIPLLG